MFQGFEFRWKAGGRQHALFIDSTGHPHLDDDGGDDAPGPSPRAKARPAQRGKRWSEEEEDRLCLRLRTAEDAQALAEELGRSRGAVLARGVRLGLIDAEEAGLRYPPGGRPASSAGSDPD